MEEEKDVYRYGVKMSDEEIKENRISYQTLASCFDAVLCNNILDVDPNCIDNLESGDFVMYYNKDGDKISYEEYEKLEEEGQEPYEHENEIFQWFIVSHSALYYLKEANELVLYSDLLDCYIWGVDHWGTMWSSVSTSLKVFEDKD